MSGTKQLPEQTYRSKRLQRAAEIRAEYEARQRQSEPAKTDESEDDRDESVIHVARQAGVTEPQIDQSAAVGDGNHVVQAGECMSSIAKDAGHHWEYLWNHADNSELREVRQDPHMLLPGDRVAVPEIEKKEESCQTEMRHRFRCLGEPAMLRLVIMDADEPRGNQPFVLKTDNHEVTGVTDAEGKLEAPLEPDARTAVLYVGEGEEREEFELNLGHLHPLDTMSGVQARLDNLGYDVGEITGEMNDQTDAAIGEFCVDHGVKAPPHGQMSEAVRQRLREVHGF